MQSPLGSLIQVFQQSLKLWCNCHLSLASGNFLTHLSKPLKILAKQRLSDIFKEYRKR